MSKELRPCPFCGGKAEVFIFPDPCGFVVRCKWCGVALHEYVRRPDCPSFEEAEQEAVERWNRRAYDAEISNLKSGIITNPRSASVMGFPMLQVVLLADALVKKGVSFEQVDDFIANVGNAYEYACKEQERAVREVLAPFGKFEFANNSERWRERLDTKNNKEENND